MKALPILLLVLAACTAGDALTAPSRIRAAKSVAPQSSPSLVPAKRSAVASPVDLCRAEERGIYSCRFGAKLASVCLGAKSVHYRFGSKSKLEFDIASTPDWKNIHIGSSYSQGGLSQTHIRFTSGAFHYVVHSGETGSLNEAPGIVFSGIVVLKGEADQREIGSRDCKAPTRFSAAFDAIRASAPTDWDGVETGTFDQHY